MMIVVIQITKPGWGYPHYVKRAPKSNKPLRDAFGNYVLTMHYVDAWRVKPNTKTCATVMGNVQAQHPDKIVRVM